MPLRVTGLSHNTAAPVEVRERLSFTTPRALDDALAVLRAALAPRGGECVLLSTCNRTELYVAAPEDPDREEMAALLLAARGIAPSEMGDWLPFLEDQAGCRAVEHLFRVTAGLESMVLGENDIVRQVKEAFAKAANAGTCGPTLNPLFHEALRVAKRARTEMNLSHGAFSIGHAAAQLAENIHGSLAGRTVLLLGAGAMSETTARHLAAAGANQVLVANRTYDRAVALAESLNGRAIHYDDFVKYLAVADIVIASTAAPHTVVHRPMVEAAMRERSRRRPLFLIDIAVPRDVDADVGEVGEVFLFNIDDLGAIVEEEAAERRRRAVKAEALIREEALAWSARMRAALVAAPLVRSVRAKHHAIVQEGLARLRAELPHLAEADWARIEAFATAIENRIAHDPTIKIKEYAERAAAAASAMPGGGAADDLEAKMRTAREIFGLEEGWESGQSAATTAATATPRRGE